MIDYAELMVYCKRKSLRRGRCSWLYWLFKHYMYSLLLIGKKHLNNLDYCDVLVLHPSDKSLKLGRKKQLLKILEGKGLRVKEIVQQKPRVIIRKKLFLPPFEAPRIFRIHEGYSNYLKKKYNPRVIVTERNGAILSSFLRGSDTITFHLSHSVLTAQSSKYDFIDFDYYSIYGESSLEYLKKLRYRYGSCRLLILGSYLFQHDFVAPPPRRDMPILLLGMGPDLEKEEEYISLYAAVLEWQKRNKIKLYIRLHPRSDGSFWNNHESADINILRKDDFKEAVAKSSLVIAPYTNAVVDAALLGRPIQLLANNNEIDFFEAENYFLDRVNSADDIGKNINKLFNDFDYFCSKAKDFSDYHLSKGAGGCELIALNIYRLVHDSEPHSNFVSLK